MKFADDDRKHGGCRRCLFDAPIFSGLAISLIFGMPISISLALVVTRCSAGDMVKPFN